MPTFLLHREDRELTGKQLSANTIASFLITQRVRTVPSLSTQAVMSRPALLFLNRERALSYWEAQGWLRLSADGYQLTYSGLDEVQSREAGEALRADGRKKGGNVTPSLIQSALKFCLEGGPAKARVLTRTFDI